MDEQIETVTGHLRPLLLEARSLMHLQDRAIASGIKIDSSFVRVRLDGWDQAISATQELFSDLFVDKAARECPEKAEDIFNEGHAPTS